MSASKKPNIIFIMADDMGYGDVGCYNAQSKIPTPNMDRLAHEGMRFTDAHSPSAGYHTACIGKWHLGLGYSAKEGAEIDFDQPLPWENADYEFEEQID